MEGQNSREYRCDCGRLLFKGDLCRCRVEVKCKKCGVVKRFADSETIKHSYCDFSLMVDNNWQIISLDGQVENFFDYSREKVLNNLLFDFLIIDEEVKKLCFFPSENNNFRILRGAIKCQNGLNEIFDVYFRPCYNETGKIGYLVFGWKS